MKDYVLWDSEKTKPISVGPGTAGGGEAGLWCYLVGAEGLLLFRQVLVLDGAVRGIYQQCPIVAEQVDCIAARELEHPFRRDKRKVGQLCQ